MSAKDFVKLYRGRRCYVTDSSNNRRYGRVNGVCKPYGTVVVEFEPYPEPGKVGYAQEWPVDCITLAD